MSSTELSAYLQELQPNEEFIAFFERYGLAYRWYAVSAVIAGNIAAVLATTIINVAIPSIMGAFGVGQDQAQWLATSNLAAATKLEETRSDRDVSRGDLQVASSRLAQVEDQLSRTLIRAPFEGVVVERLAMPGERVDIGKNVVRIVDQQHLEVIARAPLEYYSYVKPGQELAIRTGDITSSGIVRTVVAVGSENTHQFELRLDIESGSFPVGQTLRVSVPTSHTRDALVVPRDALVLRPGEISVFVVDEDLKAKQVVVTTGIGSGDRIEFNGDFADGNTVIIRGNERLRSGQSVSIMEE